MVLVELAFGVRWGASQLSLHLHFMSAFRDIASLAMTNNVHAALKLPHSIQTLSNAFM